jgi:membrane protein DedA with SNARE-associated domain
MEFVETLTRDLLEFMHVHMARYGYALLFLLTSLETSAFLGLLAPGESVVVVAGLFASRGPLALALVIPIAIAGAFLGDNAGYWLGRRFGTGILEKYGKYAFFDREMLDRVRSYYEKHGGKTVFFGRFTSIIRSFGPFVAGSSHMRYGPFALWSAAGCVAWGLLYSLIGYFFGESWEIIEKYMGRAGVIGFLCGVTLLGVYLFVRKRGRRIAGE